MVTVWVEAVAEEALIHSTKTHLMHKLDNILSCTGEGKLYRDGNQFPGKIDCFGESALLPAIELCLTTRNSIARVDG